LDSSGWVFVSDRVLLRDRIRSFHVNHGNLCNNH
jgi:hypothetical protein